jgi:hypothetical protein
MALEPEQDSALAPRRPCESGEPEDQESGAGAESVDTYLAKHDGKPGVFLILVALARRSSVWTQTWTAADPDGPIDAHYAALRHQMRDLFRELGIAA